MASIPVLLGSGAKVALRVQNNVYNEAIQPWNYFRSIPIYVFMIPELTGRRTDGQTTQRDITALCVTSRGKNEVTVMSPHLKATFKGAREMSAIVTNT